MRSGELRDFRFWILDLGLRQKRIARCGLRVSGCAVDHQRFGAIGRQNQDSNHGFSLGIWRTETSNQEPATRDPKPVTRSKGPEASDERPLTSNRRPETGDQKQKAMSTAVRILACRDHTRFEIEQKLKQRGFDPDNILAVITECERLGYLDDERTARVYISQLARRGFGFRRIRMELVKKGLRGARFEQIVSESRLEINEREIAKRALQKKLKTFNREQDSKKRKDKIYRFFYSRGFSQSVISELIREFVK
jgi:regulatory protein